MEEAEFYEVVRVLCKYATNYTPNGTFDEVMLYLEGFASGAQVGGRRHRHAHSKLTPFFNWLSRREGWEYGDNGLKNFLDSLPDEGAKLSWFSETYREYAEAEARAREQEGAARDAT